MLSELTTMALFAEVVDLRSFTAAAVTAGMAKATVSRRIAQLERRLGVRLLQRRERSEREWIDRDVVKIFRAGVRCRACSRCVRSRG